MDAALGINAGKKTVIELILVDTRLQLHVHQMLIRYHECHRNVF